MSDCAHLPTNIRQHSHRNEEPQVLHLLENANHARFRLVEDDVVNLVVAVNETTSVFWLRLGVTEECDHVVLVWNLAYGYASLFVNGSALCLRDGVEGFDLAGVEAGCFSVAF